MVLFVMALMLCFLLQAFVAAPRLKAQRESDWAWRLAFTRERAIAAQVHRRDEQMTARAKQAAVRAEADEAIAMSQEAAAEADDRNPELRCGANRVALFRDKNYHGDFWCLSQGQNLYGGAKSNSLYIPSGLAGSTTVDIYDGITLNKRTASLRQSSSAISANTQSAVVRRS